MSDDYLAGFINQAVYVGSNVPIVGDILRAVDTLRYYDDYFTNRGLSWSDVKYPTRLSNAGFSGLTNYVSSNIEKLYE